MDKQNFDDIYRAFLRMNESLEFPLDLDEIMPISVMMTSRDFKGYSALRELLVSGASSDAELAFYRECEPEALINILSKCLLFGSCHEETDIGATPIMALCGLSHDDHKKFLVKSMKASKDNVDILRIPCAAMVMLAGVERSFFRRVTKVLEDKD